MIKALYPRPLQLRQSIDTSLDYYFSGSAGDKSPLLAHAPHPLRPAASRRSSRARTFVQPRIRKDFPDTALLSARHPHRLERPRACDAHLPGLAHHVARDGSCHHG